MNNQMILQFLNDSKVVDFVQNHAALFSVSCLQENQLIKQYAVMDSTLSFQKMVNIYSLLYQNKFSIRLSNKSCQIITPTCRGFVDLSRFESIELYKEAGKQTAVLHSTLDKHFGNKIYYPIVYDSCFFELTTELLKLMASSNIVSAELINKLISTIDFAKCALQSDDVGGIHADLHSRNIITDGEKKVKIIDFDMIGYGNRIFDFAIFYTSINFDNLLFKAFNDGYAEIRPTAFSWMQFRCACLFTRLLCIASNINSVKKYIWLPRYIENTVGFLKKIPNHPPLELLTHFN